MVVLSKQCNRKIRNKTPVAREEEGEERAREREREPSELEILFLCNFRFAAPLFPQLTIEKSNRISSPSLPPSLVSKKMRNLILARQHIIDTRNGNPVF